MTETQRRKALKHGKPPVWEACPFIQRHTAGQEAALPVFVETARRLFGVSLHPLMTEQENEYIAAALWEAVERIGSEGNS